MLTLKTSFAFVDFTSAEHATAALIHPKNHHLDGRKLVVEYASADAVRRGGGAGPRPKGSSGVATAGKDRRERRESAEGKRGEKKGHLETAVSTLGPPDEEKSMDSGRRSGGAFRTVVKGARKSRPAPGAALALAKRERVAIVASQGRKIIFDD